MSILSVVLKIEWPQQTIQNEYPCIKDNSVSTVHLRHSFTPESYNWIHCLDGWNVKYCYTLLTLIYILNFRSNISINQWFVHHRYSMYSASTVKMVADPTFCDVIAKREVCSRKMSCSFNGWQLQQNFVLMTLSYCKFWIYWVGVNTKFTNMTFGITWNVESLRGSRRYAIIVYVKYAVTLSNKNCTL